MPIFERLERRMERRVADVAAGKLDQVEKAVSAIPGVELFREADRIVMSGRGLLRRWLDDMSLRHASRGWR